MDQLEMFQDFYLGDEGLDEIVEILNERGTL